MPTITVPIQDVQQSVHRAVIDATVFHVLGFFGITESDVIYNTIYTNVQQPGSSIGLSHDLSFGSNDKCLVEVTETLDADNLTDRGAGQPGQPPIFIDRRRGISIVPQLSRYNVECTIRRRTQSRPIVQNWCNDINQAYSLGLNGFLTEADFHYIIPAGVLSLLSAIAKAAAVNVPEFAILPWLRSCFSPAVTVVTDVAGGNHQYAMRHTVTDITVVTDPASPATFEQENNIGSWVSEFRITFTYERPEYLICHYPAMINNALINKHYWQPRDCLYLANPAAIKSVYIDSQTKVLDTTPVITLPICIPATDCPTFVTMGRDPYGLESDLIVGHLMFDRGTLAPANCFSLVQLGNTTLSAATLAYLKDAYAVDNTGSSSVIRVFVYIDQEPMIGAAQVDAKTLTVWLTKDIDIESHYQFAITVRTTLAFIDQDGIDIIKKHPDFLYDYVWEFMPGYIKTQPDWKVDVDDDGNVSDAQLDDLIDFSKDANSGIIDNDARYNSEHTYTMLTVLNGRIIGHRR